MFVATIILAVILALAFGAAGVAKVTNHPEMAKARARFAMPPPLWRMVGILEALGALGVVAGLHSDLAIIGVLAAAGLVAMTIGATYYHQHAGDGMSEWLPAVAMGTVAVLYAILRIATA